MRIGLILLSSIFSFVAEVEPKKQLFDDPIAVLCTNCRASIFLNLLISESKTVNRIKRQLGNSCGSTAALQGCDLFNPFSFSRREENRIEVEYVQGDDCDTIEEIYFNWNVELDNGTELSLERYFNREIFLIKPYSIGTGKHTIIATVREVHKDSSETFIVSVACIFDIRPELPIPQITGGSEITTSSGKDLKVSGKESVDMDFPPGKSGNLEFKWECTVTGDETDYCSNDLGSKSSITIPASDAIDGLTYTVTLSVKTPDTEWETTEQIIHFRINTPHISIKCLKNCPPVAQKSNSKERTIVEAVCEKYCEGLSKDSFEWSINVPNFDYDKNVHGGRNKDVFHINENVLDDGKEYTIRVTVNGKDGWSIKIKYHVPPVLSSCSITPSSGEALKTMFAANCEYPPGNYMFEIFCTQDDIDVIVEKGVKLEKLRFPLGPGAKAKVRIIDNYRFSDIKLLDVVVNPLLQIRGTDDELEKEILDKYFNSSSDLSLDKLMKGKDFEKAVQVANSLAGDLERVKEAGKDNIAKKYYSKVLEYINKMPMDSGTRTRQVGSLAAKVTQVYNSKPDPDIAALGTKICKKSGDVMLKRLKNQRFPETFWEETKESAITFAKCSQAGVKPNLDVLQSEIKVPDITTAFPIIDFPMIIEDYPDYVDDQNTSKAMNKLDQSSDNLIQICYINSKKMAITLSTKEETMSLDLNSFNTTSTLRIGREILETKIESHKVTLVPSVDFTKTRSAVHIAMCTSTRNIFWWAQKQEVFASTAIIQFNVKGTPVTNFDKPFILTFETKDNITSTIKSHEDATPRMPAVNIPAMGHDFETISVHRIDAFGKQSFIVEFIDLPNGVILDVVVADFHKPSFEEFQMKASQIDRENSKLFISNRKYYDSWYYLAVLPNSKTSSNVTKYKFHVYTLACFRWSRSETKWKFACGSTKNSSTSLIICECYHSSALVPMLVNNKVRVEETVIEEFELETQASYIIFVSVAVAFFLYCIFLTWFSARATKEVLGETIYFLSDVPSSFRYGYVLIVKTGNKSNAGSTSNVTIKIYGTKSESKEHVLNYPDPERKFLQKNEEDWFFMATEFYLGDIHKIDLWIDYLGYRPTWFCSEIEIFDIQMEKYWLFKINKWFEILRNDRTVYTAFPVEPIKSKKKQAIALKILRTFLNSFRGPHMWNLMSCDELSITRMKRLHIIYSIFVTTYVMGLYFYGCPKLQNSDSLSYTLDYQIDKYAVLITLGSLFLTFAMHFPVVWFFRHPSEDVLGKYQPILRKYPVSTNFLCWFFLITNIVISMTLLIILGFWVPYVTDLLWLTTVVGSLSIYIFIMENIVRLIFNFATNQKTRVKRIFGYIKSSLVIVEKQRIMLYKTFGAALLRPLFSHLYKPLDHLKIKEQKYWATIREKLWEIVEDLIMITIYVALLYLVILMDKDMMAYLSHMEVKELIQGTHSRTHLLEDVFHRKEIEVYLSETLIFSMQSLQWYGMYVTKNPGMTIDNANKYLGIARLRQHRTYSKFCDVDFIDRSSCYSEYYWYPEYGNFSEGWMSDEMSNRFSRMDTTWDYTIKRKAGTVSYIGTFATYPGGGFIATLGRTMQNSITNLNYLLRNNWLDCLSRCVFIEFLLYNPCTNLFSSVRITFEISATGYVEQKLDVHTTRLLFIKEKTSLIIWIILASFIVMLIVLIVKLTYRLIHKRRVLLKDIWHVVDIFIIFMSLTGLGLYLARTKVIRTFLSIIENAKNNEFVNYFHLMYTEKSLTMLAAVLVFLATLRLWKLMRFMLIVKVVEKTLLLAAPPLLALFLYQIIFMLASTFYGVLKYSDQSYDFRGVAETIASLMIASLNLNEEFDFEAITGSGYIYYSVFMIVLLGIYTIYIAIITICYAEAQFYFSTEEEYNVTDYLREQFLYYSELTRIKLRNLRLRGGSEQTNKNVYPKADEFRYANCVTLPSSKMDGMAFVAKCIVRNMNRGRKLGITNQDADLIKQTLVSLFRKDTEENEIFFISNVRGEKIKFVDDKIMLKMEMVVGEFLIKDEERLQNERRRKLYRKIVESHERKIKDLDDTLKIVLNTLNDIKH